MSAWIVGCLSFVGVLQAEPVTIVYTSQESSLGNAGGGDLAAGALVRFGVFRLSPDEIEAKSNDFDFLLDRFYGIDETRIGIFDGSDLGLDGIFSGKIGFDNELTTFPYFEDGLTGARAYVWVFDAGSIDDATEHGIFSDSSWIIPQAGTLDFEISHASPDGIGDVYVGSFDRGGGQAFEGFDAHRLVPILSRVPEPRAMVFLILAWGLWLVRRGDGDRK